MYTYKVVEVTRVVDGDTVDLVIDLGFHLTATLRFRVLGVDTPERGELGWTKATEFTRNWMQKPGDIMVDTYKTDSFGRWLAKLYRSDDVLCDELIKCGLAKAYKR